METASTTLNSNADEQELFVTDKKYNTLDQCIDDVQMQSEKLFSIVNLIRDQPPKKKQKIKDLNKPIVFVRLNSRMGKAKPVTLKCLLDTGASGSLISKEHAKKLCHKKLQGAQTVWMTPGSDLKTNYKCQCTFVMPEFFRDKVIEWDLHVSPNLGAYDMIIGRDILSLCWLKLRGGQRFNGHNSKAMKHILIASQACRNVK
jgi:Retroviral aspartyl protease